MAKDKANKKPEVKSTGKAAGAKADAKSGAKTKPAEIPPLAPPPPPPTENDPPRDAVEKVINSETVPTDGHADAGEGTDAPSLSEILSDDPDDVVKEAVKAPEPVKAAATVAAPKAAKAPPSPTRAQLAEAARDEANGILIKLRKDRDATLKDFDSRISQQQMTVHRLAKAVPAAHDADRAEAAAAKK